MNCFQVIKTVLDELYDQINLANGKKDLAIQQRLSELSTAYESLDQSNDLDYSDPITRFAYIYRYTTAHANIVYDLINSSANLESIFDLSRIKVSCIGGGPGSDILGILKYLVLQGKSPNLKCGLYDCQEMWGESWNDIEEKLSCQISPSIFVQPLDVTDANAVLAYKKFLDADLFTMIFFMSEVYAKKAEANDFFENLFENAKDGSYFLFVDNSKNIFYNWFDQYSRIYDLEYVHKENYREFQMDYSEEKRDLEPYYSKFGNPRLTAKIAYRICRKR